MAASFFPKEKAMSGKDERPSLREEVDPMIAQHGWLNVIERLAPMFSSAIANLGHAVDCPFPNRHRNGGGQDDFRFSADSDYEGRSICSCNQDGWTPVNLLIEAGVGSNFTAVYREIKKAYKGTAKYESKAAPVVKRARPNMTLEDANKARKQLMKIVKDLLPLDHPDARAARLYFKRRGIRLNSRINDVKFHPCLPYNIRKTVKGETVLELVGTFPAIVTAFRNAAGKVVNLHRIYITEDGRKLDLVSKPKKICAPVPGWRGSSMHVATVEGCRTLHVCEGVEKGWTVHLVTGESVQAGNSCTTLPGMYVDPAKYDDVVLWSDHDPYNEERQKPGDGQTYMYKLFLELMRQGKRVCFMVPDTNPTKEAKGPDWEDIIVAEGVLDMPIDDRFDYLRTRAISGGVFTPTGHAKKRSNECIQAVTEVA
jgi:hypothetical protein